mmetsp:Transcript_11349/g.20406  ORF Transcript_11349/g.20406 Transcript_11349/m.20406 type:complete len:84 (+) Transcript_11349:1242-1493(+)
MVESQLVVMPWAPSHRPIVGPMHFVRILLNEALISPCQEKRIAKSFSRCLRTLLANAAKRANPGVEAGWGPAQGCTAACRLLA